MDYLKHYINLIETRKNRILDENEYYEKHHIHPKALGGSDDIKNLVTLTAREHFIAHWLLFKLFKDPKNKSKMGFALQSMSKTNGLSNRRITSWQFEIARKAAAIAGKLQQTISWKDEDYRKKVTDSNINTWKNEELLQKHSELLKIRMNSPEVRKNCLIGFDKQRDYYLIVTPIGTEYIIKGLRLFAQINNLQQSKLSQVSLGSRDHTQGIWCKRIDDLICLYDINDNVVLKEDEKWTKEQSIKFGALKRCVPNMKNATPGSKCSKY